MLDCWGCEIYFLKLITLVTFFFTKVIWHALCYLLELLETFVRDIVVSAVLVLSYTRVKFSSASSTPMPTKIRNIFSSFPWIRTCNVLITANNVNISLWMCCFIAPTNFKWVFQNASSSLAQNNSTSTRNAQLCLVTESCVSQNFFIYLLCA